ncbi:MAG: hypothetical protein AMJ84_04855 [Acidithiobacillales bacterium SM23_46]|nr:MAG: hypothetical protein AMJ84_04855 [Acidithiobacillales bacterium SM23_46]
MAHAQIGTIQFLGLETLDDTTEKRENRRITRPGVNGAALLTLGLKSEPIRVRAFRDISNASILTYLANIAALKSTVVAVDTGWETPGGNIIWPTVLIVDVEITAMGVTAAIGGIHGTAGDAALEATFTIQRVG